MADPRSQRDLRDILIWNKTSFYFVGTSGSSTRHSREVTLPELGVFPKRLCAVPGAGARMKHDDGTMIANRTQPNEAIVATKKGLHGGFATLRFLAN